MGDVQQRARFTFRDHRTPAEVLLSARDAVYGLRSEGFEANEGKRVQFDHGDLNHAFFWPAVGAQNESRTRSRQVVTGSGAASAPGPGAASSREIGEWAHAVPAILDERVSVRPTYEGSVTDTRFIARPVTPSAPTDAEDEAAVWPAVTAQNEPTGTPGIVLAGSREDKQRLIWFPVLGNHIVAQHVGLDPSRFSTIVSDIDNAGRKHPDLNSGLETAFRVKLAGASPSVCLNFSDTPEGKMGYGAVAIRAAGPTGGQVVALMAAERGGPISGGGWLDKHRRGTGADGTPLNPAHIQAGALFYQDAERDGPLEFDDEFYAPAKKFPFLAETYLRWDKVEHLFRWETCVPLTPPTEDEPPRKEPPEKPGEKPGKRLPPGKEPPGKEPPGKEPPGKGEPPGKQMIVSPPGRITVRPGGAITLDTKINLGYAGTGAHAATPDERSKYPRDGHITNLVLPTGKTGGGGKKERPPEGGMGGDHRQRGPLWDPFNRIRDIILAGNQPVPGKASPPKGEKKDDRQPPAPGDDGKKRRHWQAGGKDVKPDDVRGVGGKNTPDLGAGSEDRGFGLDPGRGRGVVGADPKGPVGGAVLPGQQGVGPDAGVRFQGPPDKPKEPPTDEDLAADADSLRRRFPWLSQAEIDAKLRAWKKRRDRQKEEEEKRKKRLAHKRSTHRKARGAAMPNEMQLPGIAFRPQPVLARRSDLRFDASPTPGELAEWEEDPIVARVEAFGHEKGGKFAKTNPRDRSRSSSGTGPGGVAFLPPEWGIEHAGGVATSGETLSETCVCFVRVCTCWARSINLETGAKTLAWDADAGATGDWVLERSSDNTGGMPDLDLDIRPTAGASAGYVKVKIGGVEHRIEVLEVASTQLQACEDATDWTVLTAPKVGTVTLSDDAGEAQEGTNALQMNWNGFSAISASIVKIGAAYVGDISAYVNLVLWVKSTVSGAVVEVGLVDGGATEEYAATTITPTGAMVEYTIPLSDFVSVDLTDIVEIRIQVTGTGDGDTYVDDIRAAE